MSDSSLNSETDNQKTTNNNSSDAYKQPEPSLIQYIGIIFSTLLLTLWCLLLLTINLLWRVLKIPQLEKSYFLFHSGCCRLFNLHCVVEGEISASRPTLFLSNHISYLDIFVLGKYIPAYFIAKSEVAGWPILGWLAKVQNTLFFERSSKRVRQQMQVMTDHFDQKGNLILFPEGTSTNGEHVVPFKSSLLQSAESASETVLIQPVTVSYTRYKNEMMTREIRDQYAWYAKMPFASHFFNALGLAKAEVKVIFHPPVTLEQFESRKECAQHCYEQVNTGLLETLKPSV